MSTTMKVFLLDDCEWWIGEDLAACVADATDAYGEPMEGQYDDARELTDEELDRIKFHREDGTVVTFRQERDDSIARGGEFPRMFATTEY